MRRPIRLVFPILFHPLPVSFCLPFVLAAEPLGSTDAMLSHLTYNVIRLYPNHRVSDIGYPYAHTRHTPATLKYPDHPLP